MFVSHNRPERRTRSARHTRSSRLSLGYGRFLQPDPLGYDDGLNWYNYVGSDPVNGSDPSGLKVKTIDCRGSLCPLPPPGWSGPSGGDPSGQDSSNDDTTSDVIVTGNPIGAVVITGTLSISSAVATLKQTFDFSWLQSLRVADQENRHPFSVPTYTDASTGDVVVTATRNISDSTKWVLTGDRYLPNPHYVRPWYDIGIDGFLDAEVTLFPLGKYSSLGKEIAIGKNFRLAPFGNRTYSRFGRWPHYHYRPSNPAPPGEGIGRHRPWE